MLAYLLYKSWQILVQTRAVQLIKGTVVMVLIYAVSFFLQLTTLLWILNVLVPGLVIAIAIIFQPELRKIFTQIGSREWFRAGAAGPGTPAAGDPHERGGAPFRAATGRPDRVSPPGRREEHRPDRHHSTRRYPRTSSARSSSRARRCTTGP